MANYCLIWVYTQRHSYTCTHTHMHSCTHKHACTHTFMYAHQRAHTDICTHMHMYVHAHIHTHSLMYCAHAHDLTHTHIHMHSRMLRTRSISNNPGFSPQRFAERRSGLRTAVCSCPWCCLEPLLLTGAFSSPLPAPNSPLPIPHSSKEAQQDISLKTRFL